MDRPAAPADPTRTPEQAAAALRAIRDGIDAVDLQILELITRRANLATEIGAAKLGSNTEIFHPNREAEVFANILSRNVGPLGEVTVKAIFREIVSGCRALQAVPKVAYLGPEYSFSHLATLHRFGETVEFMEVGSIAAVFEEVQRKNAHYGVVPLENSTDGRIVDTLDTFARMPEIKICDEIRFRVHHCLLSDSEVGDVKRIYSKPQALSQCRNWLAKHCPDASLHEVTSTTVAARLVQSERFAAAVASREAGSRYGLKVLFQNIEDSQHNETRFAVIGPHDARRTGRDKTAMMFRTANSPGALADTLQPFKANGVNITWIESFPVRETKGEYLFFVDFDGHMSDDRVRSTIDAIRPHTQKLMLLGSFPVSKLDD